MRIFTFIEPHVTGGDAVIRITEEQIITYMRESAFRLKPPLNDAELVETFCTVHWATEEKTE